MPDTTELSPEEVARLKESATIYREKSEEWRVLDLIATVEASRREIAKQTIAAIDQATQLQQALLQNGVLQVEIAELRKPTEEDKHLEECEFLIDKQNREIGRLQAENAKLRDDLIQAEVRGR